MSANSKDKDIREFFGDSGEQDDAVLEELIASGCMSGVVIGAGFGDGVFDSVVVNDFCQLLRRLKEKYGPEVPVSECRRAFASDTPEVQEAFERHYREGRIGRFAEALDIKIVG